MSKLHETKDKNNQQTEKIENVGLANIQNQVNHVWELQETCKQSDNEQWSTGRIIDELFLCLMNVEEDQRRKYLQQANYLIYRIPIYQPTPSFIINIIDLTDKIKQELENSSDESLNGILTEAITRIFECVNKRYFNLSVRHLLKWELRE